MRPLLLVPSLICLAGATAAESPPDAFEASVKPILAQRCYACHNAMLRNADLNLESYATRDKVVADPKT